MGGGGEWRERGWGDGGRELEENRGEGGKGGKGVGKNGGEGGRGGLEVEVREMDKERWGRSRKRSGR